MGLEAFTLLLSMDFLKRCVLAFVVDLGCKQVVAPVQPAQADLD
jgi:hypothetical protein